MARPVPQYIQQTCDALRASRLLGSHVPKGGAGLEFSVLRRSLRHPFGPRIRIPLNDNNLRMLNGLRNAANKRFTGKPNLQYSSLGEALVGETLEALVIPGRFVEIVAAEKRKGKPTALHLVFPKI